jgi:hypothetical protein
LLNLFRHPAYAGAYRYGYRQTDPRRKQPGRPSSGRRVHPPEECLVLLRDRVPACISWQRFQVNQERLKANRSHAGSPGAPRNGAALLGGLVRCGRCGRRMQVHYAGRKPRPAPWYDCSRGTSSYGEPVCQSVSGAVLDAFVAGQILAAVEPAALEASLAAVAEVERERAALTRQWQLRRERARFEAERAARQYQACEPENRLVARELERRWEEALRQQQLLEDDYGRWQRSAPARLSAEDEAAIRALAADLPAVWQAETTTPADRQRIARLLLERVTVTVDKASERVDVQLHWIGGLVRSHALSRPVSRYDCRSDYPRLVERLRSLSGERLRAAPIAARLNAEGFRPPRRAKRFTVGIVLRLLACLGVPRRSRYGSQAGLEADEFRPMGLARRLGVSRDRVRRWLRSGYLSVRKDEDGHAIIRADAVELRRLRELARHPRAGASQARLSEPRPVGSV